MAGARRRRDPSGYGFVPLLRWRRAIPGRTPILPADGHCRSCGSAILAGDGAAFVDGRIVHVHCYVDGGHVTPPSLDPPTTRDQLLGIHVLIVEDSETTREMLQAALEYCGAFVTVAAEAATGKTMLRDVRPHVIVSDIAIPNDGYEMIREVLAFAVETGVSVPAIAIAASHDSRDRIMTAGFSAFVTKPLDPFVLTAVVAMLARGRRP